MNWPTYLLYYSIVGCIRFYKYLELKFLKLFVSFLQKKGKEITENVGVQLHCPNDPENTENPDKKSQLAVLEKANLRSKYDKVIHLKIHDNLWFARIANQGIIGAGESYMEKLWDYYDDVDDISEFATRILENNLLDLYYNPWNSLLEWLELHAFNLQTVERAFQPGEAHYDLGNDLFELMLDPWMQYTCGYWKHSTNLNDAQLNKMELMARKLDLKPGMRVLDIGCGWGTFCKYLAEFHNVECVGITIGIKGAEYGKNICQGLPVDIRVQDYREIDEKFDRIVSVGMFEHVGFRNYREFFKVANRCLTDDGIFLLHTIARNHSNVSRSEPWTNKYIFPNGNLPNPEDIAKETKDLFVIEDFHNFGLDYAKTLFSWRENFMKGWPQIKEKYDGDGFYRMWILYLSFARALFKSRRAQLWQLVLSKDGLKTEYRAAR